MTQHLETNNDLIEAHESISNLAATLTNIGKFMSGHPTEGQLLDPTWRVLIDTFRDQLILGQVRLEAVHRELCSSQDTAKPRIGELSGGSFHGVVLSHARLQLENLGACSGIGLTECLDVDGRYLACGDSERVPNSEMAIHDWQRCQRVYVDKLGQVDARLVEEFDDAVLTRDLRRKRHRVKPKNVAEMCEDDLSILRALDPKTPRSWKELGARTELSHAIVRKRGVQMIAWGFASKVSGGFVRPEQGSEFLA